MNSITIHFNQKVTITIKQSRENLCELIFKLKKHKTHNVIMRHHHQHWAVVGHTATAGWLSIVWNVRTPDESMIVTTRGFRRPTTLEPQLWSVVAWWVKESWTQEICKNSTGKTTKKLLNSTTFQVYFIGLSGLESHHKYNLINNTIHSKVLPAYKHWNGLKITLHACVSPLKNITC